ncbi:hypothetical protein [Flagellimonas meridianipacifica]|uniref:Uncharacterized protein n=1 Tax=Flagellimonas meridianipacifica TaxID=1080225 RepID=A0A2T0MGE9_9FLAO|nr:hypothetical protein [Allomuricauda pacifica]PRX56651.1 hypothetical protein CLV81_0648 [Allomuricauda pacifica]
MKSPLNIEIIENNGGGHNDLLFEIPKLIGQQKFDTYYFALAIEPKHGIAEIKNAVARLIDSWNKKQAELKNGQVIYLPIDFSDQYTGCLRVEKKNDLTLSYGFSRREGWRGDPMNPVDYFESITDFNSINEKSITVNQLEFEKCLTEIIEKLKSK